MPQGPQGQPAVTIKTDACQSMATMGIARRVPWPTQSSEEHTLLGSLISTYFPSGCFIHRSATVRTMPHPLCSDTFNCPAKSVGLIEVVLRITCRVLSLGLARDM